MPPKVNNVPINGGGKADPTLLDKLVQFLIDNVKPAPKPAKHDAFVPHNDADAKNNNDAEASADAGTIKGLLMAAQGLLKRIGEMMGQNITSNSIANFAKNDTAIGLGNQAKEYIERAMIFEAIKKLPGLSSLATTLNTIAASIVGFAKVATGFWTDAIKSDQVASKAIQKNADKA